MRKTEQEQRHTEETKTHLIEEQIEEVLEDVFTYDEARYVKKTVPRRLLLLLRNIAAGVAAVLFIVSFFSVPSFVRAAAYFTGAAAYVAEILIMTRLFRHRPSHDEMFMAYMFGPLYLLLGVSYLAH